MLIDRNIDFDISGTSRFPVKFSDKKVESYLFDSSNFNPEIENKLKNVTHILISTPPQVEKIIIKNFLTTLKNNKNLQWVGYLSSTSVYGDHKGNWVKETSNTLPTSEMGLKRMEAEQLLLNSNLPVRIFRLAGIYSLERNIFSRLKKKEVKIINKKDQIFSRVHVEDIAQVLFSSFSKSKDKDIFNVSDDAPCAYKEVVQYAATLLQVEMPKEINFEDLENSKMKDLYRDRKKVQNSKIKSMGVKLKHPTFKEGLTAIFNQIS
ncbi:sugar nucleotide-binding protein [Pelagibacteraceae bacterium]|nr:sugar nucleotide-binding protein [Pelagibacteraceae bacterium]MDC0413188.1 sugar nucleotide-binding protein [Pelagibacteraceae bacterium]